MYCPGCHKKLDTSLTSCDRCGWQIALGQCIPRAEHDRMMAEKGAEIAMLRAERDRWHADANLMLGFADLAYDVGACPTSSELIAARDRVVATIRNAAFEDAARMVDCACECRDAVLAAKTRVERWNACGRDPCGALDAADIRALKESPDA